jgi:putative endonuclease
MKCSLYIVLCANNRYYIGSSIDVAKRLEEHNSGKTKSIAQLLPVKLVFKQEFDDESTARSAEYRLKQKKSRSIIEKIIKDQEIKFLGP